MHPKVKDFFVRCVGIKSTCDNIQEFSEPLLCLFIVANSEYDGKESTEKDAICAKKRSFLVERIKTFTFADEYDVNHDEERDYDYLNDELGNNTNLIHFIEKIRENSQNQIDSTEVTDSLNVFYCPALTEHLIKISRHFPI